MPSSRRVAKPQRVLAKSAALGRLPSPLLLLLLLQITVEQSTSGDQTIRAVSNLQAGRLLLHWGVEGGRDYKGGWRLPEAKYRPEGTHQYKDRALQSPWK